MERKNRSSERADEPGESERPGGQRHVDQVARQHVQEIELHRARHLESAGRVHSQRNTAPQYIGS